MATGSFQGVSTTTTPRGSQRMTSVASQRALQGPAAVERAELGVLLEGPDAGLDAAAAVAERLAALAGLQLGDLVDAARAGRARRP